MFLGDMIILFHSNQLLFFSAILIIILYKQIGIRASSVGALLVVINILNEVQYYRSRRYKSCSLNYTHTHKHLFYGRIIRDGNF